MISSKFIQWSTRDGTIKVCFVDDDRVDLLHASREGQKDERDCLFHLDTILIEDLDFFASTPLKKKK